MIINQINYGNNSQLADATAISKDILYNKVGYNKDGKVIGNAPIDRKSITEGNEYYKFLIPDNGIKLTTPDGLHTGLLKLTDADYSIKMIN